MLLASLLAENNTQGSVLRVLEVTELIPPIGGQGDVVVDGSGLRVLEVTELIPPLKGARGMFLKVQGSRFKVQGEKLI